jgi:N-formylglutamate amidohydrolase
MAKKTASYIVHPASRPDVSPVIFDCPHSGTILPRHFRYACQKQDLMFLHDPHVDKLLTGVPHAGSPVLEALIHRACIDLNRHEYEVNPDWIDGEWTIPHKMTFYTSQNAGLFPILAGPRANRISDIYNDAARLTAREGERRIHDYHRPYYKKLDQMLTASRKSNASILHVDMHSTYRGNPDQQADIILGDMNSKSCDPEITRFIKTYFQIDGYSVDDNGKYFSGGAIIQHTHAPEKGIHSIQIEIARDIYMNQETLAFSMTRGEELRKSLSGLSKALNGYMAHRNRLG